MVAQWRLVILIAGGENDFKISINGWELTDR